MSQLRLTRRRALAAGASLALAGCTDRSGVVGSSVEHLDEGPDREPMTTTVAFDEDAGAVRATGFMFYGSSSCNRVGLTEVAHDATADRLRVVVDSVDDQLLPLGCTADMAATWYRATVRFADELPETVRVVEANGGQYSETRTVDRSHQRALCRTDHPEGSEKARRAERYCPEP